MIKSPFKKIFSNICKTWGRIRIGIIMESRIQIQIGIKTTTKLFLPNFLPL